MIPAGLCVLAAACVLLGSAEPGNDSGRLFFGLWRTRFVALALALTAIALGIFCAGVSRRALFGYGFALLQLGLAVAVLEGLGRAGFVSFPQLMGNVGLMPTNDLAVGPEPGLDVCGDSFQDIAWPWGVEHPAIPFCYRTNRYGFRNPPDLEQADVYLLGDSMVVSALVAEDRMIAARLAERWGRPVMNVALVGVSPQEEHALLRESGLPLEGRLVLQLLFEGNDLSDSARFAAGGAEVRQDPHARSFVRNAVLALQRLSQPVVAEAARQSCEIGGETILFRWTSEAWEGLDDEHDRIFRAVETFASEVREAGGDFGVVVVPAKLRVLGPACETWPDGSPLHSIVDANPFRDRVMTWAVQAGIPAIDLTGPLRESARAGRIPWFWGDTHWNATAQDVAAGAIVEAFAPPGERE